MIPNEEDPPSLDEILGATANENEQAMRINSLRGKLVIVSELIDQLEALGKTLGPGIARAAIATSGIPFPPVAIELIEKILTGIEKPTQP